MLGILLALAAGMFAAVQTSINTQVNQRVGLWEATALVHFVGLVFGIVMMFLFSRNISFRPLLDINKFYLLGGVFGVLIVSSAITSFTLLGAAYATILILLAQIVTSAFIDNYGLFGMQTIPMDFQKVLGAVVILIGIIIFNFRK